MKDLYDCAVTIDALVQLLDDCRPGSLCTTHYMKRLLAESSKMLELTRRYYRREGTCLAKVAPEPTATLPPVTGVNATSIPVAVNARTPRNVPSAAGGSTTRD